MSLTNLLAWSAANDAADAANEAASASREAASEASRLADIHENNLDQARRNSINKMLQDLFYNREPELFNLNELKRYVQSSFDVYYKKIGIPLEYRYHDSAFPPTIIAIIVGVLTYVSRPSWFKIAFLGITLYAGYVAWNRISSKSKWDSGAKERERKRQEKIHTQYYDDMKYVSNLFPMLSYSGIVRKYFIDEVISDTYKVLLNKDESLANLAKIELYMLLLALDDMSNDQKRGMLVDLKSNNATIVFKKEAIDLLRSIHE